MPLFDASGLTGDLFGWRSELGSRIKDKLARRSVPVTAKLGAIVRKLESAVSTAALKGAVSDLVAYFRRAEPAGRPQEDEELESLFARIHEFGRKESIESYCDFIFTVDVRL